MSWVLAVQPDAVQADVLRQALRSHISEEVVVAKSLDEALSLIDRRVPDLILIPICIRLAFLYLGRSAISHGTDVGHGSGLESLDSKLRQHVGASAVADTPLRPTGRIRIGDDTYEAQTSGDWVERGATVKVISVAGSRFQVEKKNP